MKKKIMKNILQKFVILSSYIIFTDKTEAELYKLSYDSQMLFDLNFVQNYVVQIKKQPLNNLFFWTTSKIL